MKSLFTILLFSSIFFGYSQKTENTLDTLYLKSGEVYVGSFIMETVKTFDFKLLNAKTYSSYPKDDVLRLARSEYYTKSILIKEIKSDTITNENLLIEFNKLRLQSKESGTYLKQAGGLGITSGVMILVGGGMVLAGVLTGKPVVTYAGSALGGLGLVFTIPAFVNIHKAGSAFRQ